MSAWARLVAKASPEDLEELNAALLEIQAETHRKVALKLRGAKVTNPLGEAEEHVNHCLDDLAAEIEGGR
jgi:hypothetical protein